MPLGVLICFGPALAVWIVLELKAGKSDLPPAPGPLPAPRTQPTPLAPPPAPKPK
jgi:hypothetical protein